MHRAPKEAITGLAHARQGTYGMFAIAATFINKDISPFSTKSCRLSLLNVKLRNLRLSISYFIFKSHIRILGLSVYPQSSQYNKHNLRFKSHCIMHKKRVYRLLF